MDVYNVSFKAKVEGVDVWIPVGEEWISYTANTSAMIKAVCGSYPSDWHGMSCTKLFPILDAGITELKTYTDRYQQFASKDNCGTVKGTIDFLSRIRTNCGRHPYAIVVIE